MKKNTLKKIIRAERGSSILESLIAILLLCLIFFGVMQVFHLAIGKMICDYAAFNGAKAHTLGYSHRIVAKTIRLSAMGISGKDYSMPKMKSLGKESLHKKMQLYMITGNANVDFQYWDNLDEAAYHGGTRLRHSIKRKDGLRPEIQVRLENFPLLTDGIGGLLHMGFDHADLRSNYEFYNHGQKFLK